MKVIDRKKGRNQQPIDPDGNNYDIVDHLRTRVKPPESWPMKDYEEGKYDWMTGNKGPPPMDVEALKSDYDDTWMPEQTKEDWKGVHDPNKDHKKDLPKDRKLPDVFLKYKEEV